MAYADVACACQSYLTVSPHATTAVNCQKSALIVCACLNKQKRTHIPFLQESRAKIGMTFLKSCFSRTKIETKWLAGKQSFPHSEHSLRLGAQALHKMSIDKFSTAYVTHAQFESHSHGRKDIYLISASPSANEFLR